MTDLARLLQTTRGDRSLKDVTAAMKAAGYKPFSQQALSNYERGLALPAEDRLQALANGYRIPLEELRSHYLSSTVQVIAGAFPQEQFLNAVGSARSGDHLVVISQKPIIAERPELVDPFSALLSSGAHFTYVAYVPGEAQELYVPQWDNNHAYNARLLSTVVAANTLEPAERVKYLLIGKPDPKDFAFLRAYGATCYLIRRREAKDQDSGLWSLTTDRDGKHWWAPLDKGFETHLHKWLQADCGLLLPDSSSDMSSIETAGERELRVQTLEEFVRHP